MLETHKHTQRAHSYAKWAGYNDVVTKTHSHREEEVEEEEEEEEDGKQG